MALVHLGERGELGRAVGLHGTKYHAHGLEQGAPSSLHPIRVSARRDSKCSEYPLNRGWYAARLLISVTMTFSIKSQLCAAPGKRDGIMQWSHHRCLDIV